MSLFVDKLIICFGVFLVSFFGGAAPLWIIDIDEHYFSVGNMVASGVLLAGGLVHQLPDSSKFFQNSSVPWTAEFIAGLTFVVFMILEETIHLFFSENDEKNRDHEDEHNHSHSHDHGHGHHGDKNISIDETSTLMVVKRQSSSFCETHEQHRRSSLFASMRAEKSIRDKHSHHHHDDHIAQHLHGSLLNSVVLLLALSIHSILEGMAIGVARSATTTFSTTLTIILHKAFDGYALGSAMVASDMNKISLFVLIFVFSLCTPLGVLLGLFLTFEEGMGVDDYASTAIIQAMVAGTFCYVSIVEIGMKELMTCRQPSEFNGGSHEDGVANKGMEANKLVALLFGYLTMSAFAFVI